MKISKHVLMTFLAATFGLAPLSAAVADDERPEQTEETNWTPITMHQAINIAERHTGGKASELKLKNRGEKDSYFVIETRRGAGKHEVKIDAYTGRILESDLRN